MRVVLLAAGKGKRLGKLGKKRQKAALLLAKNLAVLDKYFEKILIIVGHRKEDIEKEMAKLKQSLRKKIMLIEQPEPIGNAQAVSLAEHYIKKPEEPFVVANGDIALKEDYFDRLLDCKPPALALSVVNDPWHYGVVTLDNKGCIEKIVEKPEKGREPGNLIVSGIYYFTEDIFEIIKKTPLNAKKQEYDLADSMFLLLKHKKIRTALIEQPKHIITEKDVELLKKH